MNNRFLAGVSALILCLGATTAHSQSRVDTMVWFGTSCPIVGQPKLDDREAAPLVAAVLTSLVSSGIQVAVDAVGAAIKAGGEDQTTTWTAKTSDLFYAFNAATGSVSRAPGIACMVVLRGDFGSSNERKIEGVSKDDLEKLVTKFALSGAPYVYLESGVSPDSSNSYFRLRPQYLYFDSGEGGYWGNDKRDLVLNFSFKRPVAADKSVFASTTLSFFGVPPKTSVRFLADGQKSDWMQLPELDDAVKKDIEQIKQNGADAKQKQANEELSAKKIIALKNVFCGTYERPIHSYRKALEALCTVAEKEKKTVSECPVSVFEATLLANFEKTRDDARTQLATLGEKPSAKDYCAQPIAAPIAKATAPSSGSSPMKLRGAFTVEVALTETRKGSEFLKALGKAFESSKGDITTALKTELIPSQRAAAAKTADEAAVKEASNSDGLLVLALQAKQKVVIAEDTLANAAVGTTPGQLEQLKLAVQIAKISANTAYRNASQPLPYPEAASGL